jgi:hypothetical protein
MFSRLSCRKSLSIQFAIDITLRFGESLASVRENVYQHLDVGDRFMQAVS